MKPYDAALKKMRAICLSLPDTKETPTWGEPHFRVGDKIFSGLGEKKGVLSIGFKLELDHADAMVRRPGFARAPYVGHKGWVSMDVTDATDWDEARALIEQSYKLIAPKKTVAKWLGDPSASSGRAGTGVRVKAARTAAPKKAKGARARRSAAHRP